MDKSVKGLVKRSAPADVYYAKTKKFGSRGYLFIHPSGVVAAVSDFGNYAYCWPARGRECDIKEFLLEVEEDYLLSKISGKTWLDEEATMKAVINRILSLRREGRLTKSRARELYMAIRSMRVERLLRWAEEVPELPEAWRLRVFDYPPAAKAFAKLLWPLFMEQLKAEQAVASEAPGEQSQFPSGFTPEAVERAAKAWFADFNQSAGATTVGVRIDPEVAAKEIVVRLKNEEVV